LLGAPGESPLPACATPLRLRLGEERAGCSPPVTVRSG
jgi:hypothetical protein